MGGMAVHADGKVNIFIDNYQRILYVSSTN